MKSKIYKSIIILVTLGTLTYLFLFIYSIAMGYEIRSKSSVIKELNIKESIISDKSFEPIYIFKCDSNSISLPSEICLKFKDSYPKLCNQPNLSYVYNQYDFCESINYKNEVPFEIDSCSEHLFHLLKKKFNNSFFIPYDDFVHETKNLIFLNIFFNIHEDFSIELLRLENERLEVFSKTTTSIITKNGSLLHLVLPSEVNKNLISILPYSKFTECDIVKSLPN
ncbi:hypothetical protein [Leptospira meyeri]|uniref:hypothetical protein n=1 Tax=Leptospira meyeri TaxID=29508 RepID=UPI0002BE6987|nr:hypothetical protein [Leptospira meyeri]EMJ87078.1 hypothetical protein LEP1GSC196_2981 [Leptospira meyeri serovar Semaranga str. Veldrot Semarang 173]